MRSLEVVQRAKARVAPGQNVITVAGESAWPLTWYLRDVPTAWATRIDQASTPVIIADWDPEGALEKQLSEKYDAKRVPIRAWWFPEPRTEAGKTRPAAAAAAPGTSTRSGAPSARRTRLSSSGRTSAAVASSSRST